MGDEGSGIDLEELNASGNCMLPVPGTFVIDCPGHVAYAHVDADYRNRPEPQEIVAICRSSALARIADLADEGDRMRRKGSDAISRSLAA